MATVVEPELRFTAGATIDLEAAAKVDRPARIEVLAYNGGIMAVAGYGRVVVDLAGLELGGNVTLLADHNASLDGVVGSGVPRIEGGRLTVSGELVRSAVTTQKLLDLARAGVQFQASIGAEVLERQSVRQGEKITANGQTHIAPSGGLSFIKRAALREVSLLAVGADPTTAVADD